jgi:vacuolar-type H+-ATPase subunit F/Vma7
MADLLVIVGPELADGFRLAGARVWPAANAIVAQDLVLRGLEDPDAGIIALADDYIAALDPRTRRLVERRFRPLVVALPARPALTPEQQRREYLLELIRRAVGFKIVLGGGRSATG